MDHGLQQGDVEPQPPHRPALPSTGSDQQRRISELENEVRSLREALTTNRTIAMAVGMVMQRFNLDKEAAFDYLKRISQSMNVKLRLVAEDIVNDCRDTTPTDGA